MQTSVASLLRRAATTSQLIGASLARPGRAGLLGLALVLGGALPVSAAKWNPVSPADLALTASVSSPGADAEILLSEHRLEQMDGSFAIGGAQFGGEEMTIDNYIRAKVYTAKGVEEQGKFSIEFPSTSQVRRLEARVVKPDGSSVELTKADYFESVLVKVGDEKRKKIAFTFPNLAPGDIVEFRWIEHVNAGYWSLGYWCQERVPVREYRFTIGKLNYKSLLSWMNCPTAEQSEKGGDFAIIARNMPAFEGEENMPPSREFRGWIFLIRIIPTYSNEDTWKLLSSRWAEDFEMETRPGSFFKKKAAELVAGAATDEEKLRKLYDFCQREITNYSFFDSPEIQAARDKLPKKDSPSSRVIVERRAGKSGQIDYVFASLARGAGYEVCLARSASKADMLNIKLPQGWAFLDRSCIGVKVGEQWRYFSPGNYFVPAGMMSWMDEGAAVLQCNGDKLLFDRVPASPINQTRVQRKGRFTLDAEGTLEGEVEEGFTGHQAAARKDSSKDQSLEDVNKDFREEITKRLPNAEVSEVVWTNLRTRELPLTVKYHVKVSGYAEQAGTRLVFAPGFFEAGKPVVFAAAERKYPIFFSYPWGEHDDIEIVLPAGYALDKPSAPAPVGEAGKAFSANYKLQYNPKTRTFGFQRDFALGANGAFAFQVESYPLLKGYFEQLHKSDMHSIMLKPKAAPAASAPAATPAADSPATTAPAIQP